MIGAGISERAVGEAGLRTLASEWGGARPDAAGGRTGSEAPRGARGAATPARERRGITARRGATQ
jgi:hypothetical protein